MLEDFRKVMVDRRGEEEKFTSDHIAECAKKGNIGSSLLFVVSICWFESDKTCH